MKMKIKEVREIIKNTPAALKGPPNFGIFRTVTNWGRDEKRG